MRFVQIQWSTRDVKPLDEIEFKNLIPALSKDLSILRWGEELEYLSALDAQGHITWEPVK